MTLLPKTPSVAADWRTRLERLLELTRHEPPADLPLLVREELSLDLSARYAGISIPHPFGKASGQLSCTPAQVEIDVAAGIGFIVLKTVIAEDAGGQASMQAWTVPETRMRVERRSLADGRAGWTVTWKGRGWTGNLEAYLQFFEAPLDAARTADIPVIPSVKYHLPAAGDDFRLDEYHHTTSRLLTVWDRAGCGGPMVLEKDFSPTLAGDDRAQDRAAVLAWLRQVPTLIHRAGGGRVRLGVKVMNALFDDAFQVEMVRTLTLPDSPAAFLIVFNRLFDPDRGVAFGGWELSDRNLRVLDMLFAEQLVLPPLSATGNICSGRMMMEYALRGCENGQIHTFFQVPLSEYIAAHGSRTARALHTLILHPVCGLAVWLRHCYEAGLVEMREHAIHFLDVVDRAPTLHTSLRAAR